MTCFVTKVYRIWLWHRIFHIKFNNIGKAKNTFFVRDLPKIVKPTNVVYNECVMAKQKKVSFPRKKFTTIEKLEIVPTYLSGPTRKRRFYGEMYFMILFLTLLG